MKLFQRATRQLVWVVSGTGALTVPAFAELPRQDVYENRVEMELEGENDIQAWSGSSELPKSMGAFGDSITAGALANYHRKDAPFIAPFFLMQEFLAFIVGNGRPTERRDYSWATGLNIFKPVNSHAHRLKKLIPRGQTMKVYNAAFSGAESQDVSHTELDEMMAWSQQKLGQAAPDYVTVLIGPNNICADDVTGMTPTSDFQRDLAYTVDTILQQSPRSHILIAAIPKIDTLRGVSKDAPLFRVEPVKTCEDLWKLAKVCPTLTLLDEPAAHEQVSQRVRDYNYALRDLAETRAKDHGDRVRFSGQIYEENFTADDVSVDCFHPNPIGQNKLAEKTWSDSWWH